MVIPIERGDLARSLLTYWLIADNVGPKQKERSKPLDSDWGASELTTRVLLALCRKLGTAKTLPAPFTVSPSTLSFKREDYIAFVKNEAEITKYESGMSDSMIGDIFYKSNGFFDKTTIFLTHPTFKSWLLGPVQLRALVPGKLLNRLPAELKTDDAVTFPGVVFNGYDGGRIYVGVRSIDELRPQLLQFYPKRYKGDAPEQIAATLAELNGGDRALLLREATPGLTTVTARPSLNVGRPPRLLVCGSKNLRPELVPLVEALGRVIIKETSLVLVNGGRISPDENQFTDEVVLRGAEAALKETGQDPHARVLTLHEGINDPTRPRRSFGETRVMPRTTEDSRRLAMILESDAAIFVSGNRTRDLIDLAWLSRKITLPLACTGDASGDAWTQYGPELAVHLGLTPADTKLVVEGSGSPYEIAQRAVAIIQRCLRPRAYVAVQSEYAIPQVVETITSVLHEKNYEVVLAEHFLGTGSGDSLLETIRGARVVVIDLTSSGKTDRKLATALYELGIAHSLGKQTFLTMYATSNQIPEHLPTWVSPSNVCTYGSHQSLRAHLATVLPSAHPGRTK